MAIQARAVEVKLRGSAGGYLFLADSFAPGWRARVDGKETRIRPADVAFRTVALPRTAKSVVFQYEPETFRVGLFASLIALGAALTVAGYNFAFRVK